MKIAQRARPLATGALTVGLLLPGIHAHAQNASPASNQESAPTRVVPTNNVVLTGYGTSGFDVNT
jgi:hypothetical protein